MDHDTRQEAAASVFKEHYGSDTRRAALVAVTPKLAKTRQLIRDTIAAFPEGMTADEAATLLDYKVLYARPRIAELAKSGDIVRTGERRKNVSGLSAAVWRAVAA